MLHVDGHITQGRGIIENDRKLSILRLHGWKVDDAKFNVSVLLCLNYLLAFEILARGRYL